MEWISTLEKARPSPEPVHPSANKDYQKYLRARAVRPGTIPPAAIHETTTTNEELKFSFFFWWYPGNVFEKLMIPGNEELAARLLAGEKLAGHLIPTPLEREAETAALAKQPIMAEEDQRITLAPAAPVQTPEIHDEHLDSSPTAHADHAAPPAGDPAAGFATDSGPGPSNGTP